MNELFLEIFSKNKEKSNIFGENQLKKYSKLGILIWTFGNPPIHAMSTWFMNAPQSLFIMNLGQNEQILSRKNWEKIVYF